MNVLKQSFKFCCFLRKGILYKLYLVASTNSFILFQMPAIAWSCMNVRVKNFPFKHWDSKTQQWKYLNCWFCFLKKKIILKTAHSYAMFPPWLNYTLPTGKKIHFPLSIYGSISPPSWGFSAVQTRAVCTLHQSAVYCLKKSGFYRMNHQAREIQRSVPGPQLREHLNCA